LFFLLILPKTEPFQLSSANWANLIDYCAQKDLPLAGGATEFEKQLSSVPQLVFFFFFLFIVEDVF
jgi:hypothetical protein